MEIFACKFLRDDQTRSDPGQIGMTDREVVIDNLAASKVRVVEVNHT